MPAFPLAHETDLKARALFVGERIDLRALETTSRLATSPLTLSVRNSGCAVLFRYGAVVLFNVDPIEEVAFLDYLKKWLVQPFDPPETEEVEVRIDPNAKEEAQGGTIFLGESSVERVQLIAEILAKSVVLARYETRMAQSFDRIEPLATSLEQTGRYGQSARELLRHIGGTLLSLHKMVGRVEVVEKPELLWEHPELGRFYAHLEDEYEVQERHRALEQKLELVSRTAETVLNLLQNRRSLRVEWYILVLIVVEIFLTVYEMFVKK